MHLKTNVHVDEARDLARVELVGALNTDTAPQFGFSTHAVKEASKQH